MIAQDCLHVFSTFCRGLTVLSVLVINCEMKPFVFFFLASTLPLQNRPVTAAFLRSLATGKGGKGGTGGGRLGKRAVKAQGSPRKNGGDLDGDVVQ